SMITRDGGTMSVHRLVQAIARTAPRDADGYSDPLFDALAALARCAPDTPLTDVSGWPLWTLLLPHVAAATSHLPADHTNSDALYLRGLAATFHQGQGHLATAA